MTSQRRKSLCRQDTPQVVDETPPSNGRPKRYSVSAIFSAPQPKRKAKAARAPVPETIHEDEEANADTMKKRAVIVRTVYSKARQNLKGTNSGMGGSDNNQSNSSRLSLVTAAKAIQGAAREAVLGRGAVSSFLQMLKQGPQEKHRLHEEMEKLEQERKEAEEKSEAESQLAIDRMKSSGTFMSTMLADLEKLKIVTNVGGTDYKQQVNVLTETMDALMAKMQALQGMYSMELRNCGAINAQIDNMVKDCESLLASVGDVMKRVNGTVQDMGGSLVEQLQQASANGPLDVSRENSNEQQQPDAQETSSPLRRLSLKRSTTHTALWRKAAIIASFERCLFGGTMKALNAVVEDVRQAAISSGRKPIEPPGWMETREKSRTSSPKSRVDSKLSGRGSGTPTGRGGSGTPSGRGERTGLGSPSIADPGSTSPVLVNSLSRGSSRESSRKSTLSPAHRGSFSESPISPLLPDSGHDASATPDKGSRADGTSTNDQQQSGQGSPRRARLLAPREYPAIGHTTVVLPPNVTELMLTTDNNHLEDRFRCPFAMLPFTRVPKHLPPLTKSHAKALRSPKQLPSRFRTRVDHNAPTLEKVLAERESRGLREGSEEDKLEDDSWWWQP